MSTSFTFFAPFVTGVFLLAAPQLAPQPAKSKVQSAKRANGLTLQQIEKLLAIQTPDEIISSEIKARGMAGIVDSDVIEKVRQAGAGPATLKALYPLVPKADLSIHTTPGVTVFIDGQEVGISDSAGLLTLSGLDPGVHDLRLTKQFFHEYSSRSRLAAHSNIVNAPLQWAVGFLSLSTSPADATIAISGIDQLPSPITKAPLSIGEHTISASAPFKQSISRVIQIEGGKVLNMDLTLHVDEAAVQRLRANIVELAAVSNDSAVIHEARIYHSVAGPDPQVLSAEARAYQRMKSYSELVAAVLELVSTGGAFSFAVIHDHTGLALIKPHPAFLTFTGTKLQYRPEGICITREFSLPLSEIRLEIRASRVNFEVLTVLVPNGGKGKKEVTMNFLASDPKLLPIILNIARRLDGPRAQ